MSTLLNRHSRSLCVAFCLLVCAPNAIAEVDPDCLEPDGVICHKGRLEDAKLVDQLIAPILAKRGWDRGCFTVRYIKGDEGRPDVLLVMVHGPRGSKPPECILGPNPGLSREEARQIYDQGGREREMLRATATKSIAQGKREAATSTQLREIGEAIKKVILASDAASRRQILRNTRYIGLGSGYGATAEIPLP